MTAEIKNLITKLEEKVKKNLLNYINRNERKHKKNQMINLKNLFIK